MIDIDKLRGKIVEKGLSQRVLAQKLGMAPKTFYNKMQKGVFDSSEIEAMADILELEDLREIFFVKK